MEHLTGLDASFLEAEDSDPHVSLALGAVSVMEGPLPDDDSLVSALRQRMLTVPRCRQVLRTHPFDVGAPEWVEDANLDLSHHLRRAAVAQPGDDHALFRLVAYIMERRLDRDHPLWECWIIEGLADNRWAILTKMHHCMADGIAAMQVLGAMSDDDGGDTFATAIRTATEPNGAQTAMPTLTWNPLAWMQGVWHASTAVFNAATRAIGVAEGIVSGLARPAAGSSLIGPVTTMRRYSAARVSLDDVARVCRAYDVTINDVALAAITDSFRAALIRRGEQPKPNSVRTLVPVSVRSNDAMGEAHNLVSAMPGLPARRRGRPGRAAAHRAHATQRRQGQRTTPGCKPDCHRGGLHPVRRQRQSGSRANAIAATRYCHGDDERPRSPTAGACPGPPGSSGAADSADSAASPNRDRHIELRERSFVRHHRRPRHRTRCGQTGRGH